MGDGLCQDGDQLRLGVRGLYLDIPGLQWVSVETRTRIPFDLDAIAQLRPFERTKTHKAAVPSRKCQSLGIAHVVLKGPPTLDLAACSLGIRS